MIFQEGGSFGTVHRVTGKFFTQRREDAKEKTRWYDVLFSQPCVKRGVKFVRRVVMVGCFLSFASSRLCVRFLEMVNRYKFFTASPVFSWARRPSTSA